MVLTDSKESTRGTTMMTFINTITTKYRQLIIIMIAVVLSFCLGLLCCYCVLHKGDKGHLDTNMSDSTSGLISTTSIQLEPKSSPSDEDLSLQQSYVANINGEKVSIPIVKKKDTDTTSKPNSSSGTAAAQTQGQLKTTITQTVDLTPVLSKLKPSWELGIGAARIHNETFGCLSVQRNYKATRAIQLTGYVSQEGSFKGVEVQHKWLLR